MAMLGWMAVTVAAAWLPPRRMQPYVIAGCSAVFLSAVSPLSCGILAVSGAVSYWLGLRGRHATAATLAAVGSMAAVILWFKIGRSFDISDLRYAVIPLGLSYYGFKVIHFAVERWKQTLPAVTFGQYACYLFFLPTLIAGPINRFQEFHRSFFRRRWDGKMFALGFERILHGYAKIVILGNYLVSLKLGGFVKEIGDDHAAWAAYLDCVRHGANLYFQFAGYTDVVVGFAMLLGFSVCENFNRPFLATNISEFWNRWHMSLSSWCRDYIYMPTLAMSRKSKLAVLAAMVVLGLWHEISWRYLIWGMYHGLGLAVWQQFQAMKRRLPAPRLRWQKIAVTVLAWFVTMNFVLLGFVFTKEVELGDALSVLRTIFAGGAGD